jgi:hypothetical protein
MKKKFIIWRITSGSVIVLMALYISYRAFTVMPEADRWWMDNSVATTGTVVGLRETYRSRAYCYYPVIKFTADDGKKYAFTSHDCFSRDVHSINQRIPVRYKRGDPSDAYIDSRAHATATYYAVYAISGFMIIAGLTLVLSAINRAQA